jgi:hypothetical protein
VVRASLVILALAATLEIALRGDLGALFDVVFVLVCAAAALLVRPRDFFVVGVLPPLLLLTVVVTVTVVDRDAVARASDSAVQAVVSGLAHHAVALTVGYALTLAVLGLRQIALRNHGALRRRVAQPAAVPAVPAQRRTPEESSAESPAPSGDTAETAAPATPETDVVDQPSPH